jgi:ATP-dependent Clp protease ATP-binding subunit ClpC
MFDRYTDPAKRAVFYARAVTILNDAPVIDSMHLLLGLMWGKDSRAESLFHLREQFPVYTGCPHKCASYQAAGGSVREGPALANDAKRCVARATSEADVLRDYWIDTEHLLLGMLGERSSLAAQCLSKAGLELRAARRVVIGNKSSRPEYGPVSLWWRLRSPLEWLMFKLGLWKYLR